MTWRESASCRGVDPELFFTQADTYGVRAADRHVKTAKRVCAACPVRGPCLQWALKVRDQWAILGGTTPTERARIQRKSRVRRGVA